MSGKTFLKILLWLGSAVAVFFLVRSLWRGWHTFEAWLLPWWRARLGKPVFALLVKALETVDGELFLFFGMIAVVLWAVTKISGGVMAWSFANVQRQQMAAANTFGSIEAVQDQLKAMFAEDLETIAFYESRLGTSATGGSGTGKHTAKSSQLVGCGGCLVTFAWTILGTPVLFMISIAFFDGVLKLFSNNHKYGISPHLSHPFPPTHYHSIALDHRSALLTLLVVAVNVLIWIVSNVSITGHTWPRLRPKWMWLALVPIGIVIYFVLNGLLLLWALATCVVWLIDAIAKQVWRGPALRLRGLTHRLRKKAPEPAIAEEELAPQWLQ